MGAREEQLDAVSFLDLFPGSLWAFYSYHSHQAILLFLLSGMEPMGSFAFEGFKGVWEII
jgi:hypothetical protein